MSTITLHDPEPADGHATGVPRMYLTVRLGSEHYGIDILRVQEIRAFARPSALAGSPPNVLGAISLRGCILPIFDLRRCLDRPATYGDTTVTVILALADTTLGVVVDAVGDVVPLEPGQIEPVPGLGEAADTGYIAGIARFMDTQGERALILLDIARVVGFDAGGSNCGTALAA